MKHACRVTDTSKKMQSQPIHHNITCRECSRGTILGKRYRCMNCSHFNVCAACIDYTDHNPTHVFALITRPLDVKTEHRALLGTVLYETTKKPDVFFGSTSTTTTTTTQPPRLEHPKGPLFNSIISNTQTQKKDNMFTFTAPTYGQDPVTSMFGNMKQASPPSFPGFGATITQQNFFGSSSTTQSVPVQPGFSFGKPAVSSGFGNAFSSPYNGEGDIEIDRV